MVETASKSLADECARLCLLDSRLQGVKGDMKHAKREASAKLKMRHYHVQNPDDVKYKHIGFVAEKLTAGVLMMDCYNIRADPGLGLGVVALRRIPCACQGCLGQLSQPWKVGIPSSEQPRYAKGNNKCERWHIFHGLNDWHILRIDKTKRKASPALDSIADAEFEEAQNVVLEGIGTMMAEKVSVNGYGAILTSDPEAGGYYVVSWDSPPYTLQEDIELTEYDPPLRIPAGELVASASWLNRVPLARNWYTASEMKATVRMKQIVAADLSLDPISNVNRLPNTCNKAEARRLGAKHVSDEQHEEILDEIARRAALDHDEMPENESDSNSDSPSSSSDDSDTDSDESSTDNK